MSAFVLALTLSMTPCTDVYDNTESCVSPKQSAIDIAPDVVKVNEKNAKNEALAKQVGWQFIGAGGATLVASTGLWLYAIYVNDQLQTLSNANALEGRSLIALRNQQRFATVAGATTAVISGVFFAAGISFFVFDPEEGGVTDFFSFMNQE